MSENVWDRDAQDSDTVEVRGSNMKEPAPTLNYMCRANRRVARA